MFKLLSTAGCGSSSAVRGSWAALTLHARRGGLFTCAACSLFAVALLVFRQQWAGHPKFLFLYWNLFLAWVPWGLAWVLSSCQARGLAGWVSAPLYGVWWLFLPNAPYLITDLLHLRPRAPLPAWYDATLFFAFGMTGLILGLHSMAMVHRRIEAHWGKRMGWLFVGASAVSCGFGTFLGRFLRWNSWDVTTQPERLLRDIGPRLLSPLDYPHTWAMTLMFATLMLVAYGLVWRPAQDAAPAD